MIQPKPLFMERMKKLLPDEKDFQMFLEFIRKPSINSIRCNTLKISPEKLKIRLESKGWVIKQPYENKEIMIVCSDLKPGELGKSIEHILGYYYIQELSSMMPVIALKPKPQDLVLDLTASPGSKTTQLSCLMENQGTIIANDREIKRITILSTNLERCSCSNVVVTRHDAVILCKKLARLKMKFNKILLDLPCSGEGNIRGNPKTLLEWNLKTILRLRKIQKKIVDSAIGLLKEDGELVYSTCTYAPEENESVVSYIAEKHNLEIEAVNLPLKYRSGIKSWEGEDFVKNINKACRIYPQDNNSEGFFLVKMKKI